MKITKTKALRKVKNHIEKRGKHTTFEITEGVLLYWWKLINIAVFDNALPQPKAFIIREMRDAWGQAEPCDKTNNTTFYIDPRIDTREALICILAHEMVHQWQHWARTNVPKDSRMSHGKTFYQWKPVIESKLGVKLEVETDAENVRVD